MYCKTCRNKIEDNFNYCPYCNRRIYKKFKFKKIDIFIMIIFLILFATSFIGIFITSGLFNMPDVKYVTIEDYKKVSAEYKCPIIDMKEQNQDLYSDFDTYLQTDNNICPYLIRYIIIDNSTKRRSIYNGFVYELNHDNGQFMQTLSINVPKYTRNSTTGRYYLDAIMIDNEIITMGSAKIDKKEAQILESKLGIEAYQITFNINCLILMWINISIVLIYLYICWWKLNVKLGRKGYICLIPIYNLICLSEDVFHKKWKGLLFLVPFVNYILFLILCDDLLKKYNKNSSYLVVGIFFPLVLFTLIALDINYQKRIINR